MVVLEKCIRYFYKCLETYVETLILPIGRRIYYVLLACTCIFVLSTVLDLFGIPSIIGVLESFFAMVILAIMCVADFIRKRGIRTMISNMLRRSSKEE